MEGIATVSNENLLVLFGYNLLASTSPSWHLITLVQESALSAISKCMVPKTNLALITCSIHSLPSGLSAQIKPPILS